MANNESPILLFDGVCNLCNGAVQFIIKRDPGQKIRFASLQSSAGQKLLAQFDLPTEDFRSLVLIEGDRLRQRSGAALRVCRYLRQPWPLATLMLVVPPFIRDFCYDFVAVRRYRWFGRQESCWLPTPDLKKRFLVGEM